MRLFSLIVVALLALRAHAAYFTCAADDHVASKVQVSQSQSLAQAKAAALANCRQVSRTPVRCSIMACRQTAYAPLGQRRSSTNVPVQHVDNCLRQCLKTSIEVSACHIGCGRDSSAIRQCVNNGGSLGDCESQTDDDQGCFRACEKSGRSTGECNAQCS